MSTATSVLVTGASGTLGQAICLALTPYYGRIGIHYHCNREGAEATLAAVREAGGDGVLLAADLTDATAVAALGEQLARELPGCVHLVNNAGDPVRRVSILDCQPADVAAVMALNFGAVVGVTQLLLPGMLAAGSGSVVNVSSIGVKFGGGDQSFLYAAAKGAVETLTVGLARRYAARGVRVNCVRSGVFRSALHERHPKSMAERAALIPAKRLAEADEVATAVKFLLGGEASFVTGEILTVAGGE